MRCSRTPASPRSAKNVRYVCIGGNRLQRRQRVFDSLAARLQPRRQDKLLPEFVRILIAIEARPVGGQLEERTARLLEVYRPKPEAVDLLGRLEPNLLYLLAQGHLFLIVVHAPGDVVDGARPPPAPGRIRPDLDLGDGAGPPAVEAIAVPPVLLADLVQPHNARQEHFSRL